MEEVIISITQQCTDNTFVPDRWWEKWKPYFVILIFKICNLTEILLNHDRIITTRYAFLPTPLENSSHMSVHPRPLVSQLSLSHRKLPFWVIYVTTSPTTLSSTRIYTKYKMNFTLEFFVRKKLKVCKFS